MCVCVCVSRSDYTLRDTLAKFDRDGDGLVSAKELRQYLSEVAHDIYIYNI